MKTKNNILTFGLMVLALVLTSCSAEDGVDGSDGLQGLQGTTGVDGEDGADGQDGNANVISSDWFSPSDYTLTTGFGGINLLENEQAAAEITQEIIDSGVVLTYGKLNGYATSIWPLDQVSLMPISLTYNSSPSETDNWKAILSAGNVTIRFTNSNNTYSSLSSSHSFRYVVIPESVSAKSVRLNYEKMSYKEVMDHFGLEY